MRIRRLNTSFWGRLDGSLDVGASYTSASSLFNLDFAASLRVERPGHELTADASSTLSSQPEVEDTRRSALVPALCPAFPGPLGGLGQGQLEQNRELGFDLRSSAAAGGGRYLVQSRRDRLLTGLGLSVNRERPTEGETTTNLEAMALIRYDRFSYDFPKVDVSVAVGRVRQPDRRRALSPRGRLPLEARAGEGLLCDTPRLRELRQPARHRRAPTNDYGITFALGWSF